MQIKLEQGMDQTRKICTVTMKDAPAQVLGADKPADLEEIFNRSIVALSHEMIGGAQKLLDSAIEYTKLRVQFGRSISSFQAINIAWLIYCWKWNWPSPHATKRPMDR